MYGACAGGVVFHGVVAKPVALIIALHARFAAPVIVSGQERLIAFALSFQRFQFAGHIHFSIAVVAYIKRYHADGVACNKKLVALGIIEGEGEDAAEVVEKVDALLAIQCQYNLAVATRLKLIFPLEAFSDVLMVIYLAVYGQHLFLVGGEERLTSRLGVDNAQSFMAQDGRSTCIDTTPVGSTVPYFLTHT